jgi:hypothetical protein
MAWAEKTTSAEREEEDGGGGVGSAVTSPPPFYLEITVDLSHWLRSGNGGANLAAHVSAPRESWPPLRAVTQETAQTFFTHARDVQSKMVNSRDVRPLGLPRVSSCQNQQRVA